MEIFLIIVTLITLIILGVKVNDHLKDIRYQVKKNAETLRETKTLAEKLSIQIAQLKGGNVPASAQPSTVKEEKKRDRTAGHCHRKSRKRHSEERGNKANRGGQADRAQGDVRAFHDTTDTFRTVLRACPYVPATT